MLTVASWQILFLNFTEPTCHSMIFIQHLLAHKFILRKYLVSLDAQETIPNVPGVSREMCSLMPAPVICRNTTRTRCTGGAFQMETMQGERERDSFGWGLPSKSGFADVVSQHHSSVYLFTSRHRRHAANTKTPCCWSVQAKPHLAPQMQKRELLSKGPYFSLNPVFHRRVPFSFATLSTSLVSLMFDWCYSVFSRWLSPLPWKCGSFPRNPFKWNRFL